MSNTFDKLSVLDSFIEEVNSYLPEIETNLERLAQSPGDMDALEETYRRSHTIGGSASMMDFPGLAHVAHGMEDILGDALDGLTTLDESTIGLLRRSLGRLHRLLEGIRGGIDEESVIAEDDADYARYRAMIEPSLQGAQSGNGSAPISEGQESFVSPSTPQYFEAATPATSSSFPSFEDVLASFRTPSVTPGEDMAWPEDTAPVEQPGEYASQYPPQTAPQNFVTENRSGSSAWDELVASARPTGAMPTAPISQAPSAPEPSIQPIEQTRPQPPVQSIEYMRGVAQAPEQPEVVPAYEPEQIPAVQEQRGELQPEMNLPAIRAQELADIVPVAQESSSSEVMPEAYEDIWQETRVLEEQATSLKNLIGQLRSAMSVIEDQRREFKSFLDGSKDALDRMEDWAGLAMGLNLRNSPEQVRRYLPLSVMWVSNSKLKKVLDQLHVITGGIEVTDEQVTETLQQLQSSIASFGEAFQQAQGQNAYVLKQESGWSPWEMQPAADPASVRERVTFERYGDPIALRAELEQQIREELRREFEAKEQLRERTANPLLDVSLKEIEARLRGEIEIEVRREFLNQLSQNNAQAAQIEQATPPDGRGFTNQLRSTDVSAPLLPTVPVPPVPEPMATPAAKGLFPVNDYGEDAVEIFRAEAEEHLQTISMHVAALQKDPMNRDLIQGIRRATHTLKGAAGMMGFRPIADLCHVSEDLLDSIMESTSALSPDALSLILDTAEALDILITGKNVDGIPDEARVNALRARYIALLGAVSTAPSIIEEDLDVDHPGDHAMTSDVLAGEQAGAGGRSGARAELTVRVRLHKLDELVNLFGELLVNRSVLEERTQRLARLIADVGVSSNRLREVGQKLESRFEAVMLPSGRSVQVMPGDGSLGLTLNGNAEANSKEDHSHLSEFDELELDRYTEFHQLARGLSESVSDMATLSAEMDAVIRECESILSRDNRLNTSFQDRLMKVRLVPLSNLTPRLYRTAYSVALKQHKEIDFAFEGEDTEVDRTVYEEISGPLLHLIRNAVNHAIEAPAVRVQKGKPAAGQIRVSATYEGNQIVITVRDDGTGIDTESVRRTAIAHGLIHPNQALSESDLIDLIFRPGFSTAQYLSEESGRGVGLDVVRDSVSRLRGTLVVETTPGQGTAFTMTFPTSLAIQSVMMLRVSGHQFAIPTVSVESIGRLDNFKRSVSGGQAAVVAQNNLYPLHMLSHYLSLPATPLDDKAQLLLISAGGRRVALVVDEIKGKSDIVMKNLGPHLRQVHGIAGGTVMGNGRVVLVLELNDLLKPGIMNARREATRIPPPQQTAMKQQIEIAHPSKQSTTPMRPAASAPSTPERGKHILVVDDSPSVRRVVSGMLKQRGWEVQTARDGQEALDMISYETPAAVLLDIEMPRMDGYELISAVRAQSQYRTLPLVVLTSRAASKHQQRAMLLGASAYVIKPYQDEELLNILSSLVYGAVAR